MIFQITFLGIAHLHLNKNNKQSRPTSTWIEPIPFELSVLITFRVVHYLTVFFDVSEISDYEMN
jgi:hypothetical protein